MESKCQLKESQAEPTDRDTLCLPDLTTGVVSHGGDPGFRNLLKQYYDSPESNAAERLVKLKEQLTTASTHDFWGILMEEMCDIMGSQCGFVAKRILLDDENLAVEMPPLGEPGSCLMGVAFYLNNGSDVKQMHHNYRYHAYGSPCAYMKHDKVFIIPERLTEFVPNSPNKLPWDKSEAFIGVPLFSEGKSFAHFGMIWSEEGAANRPKLSWGYIEMFMHSLEDLILQRLLDGRGFAKQPPAPESTPARIIPLDAITASQSLKPYARSLSHELRTPMQGVVGMLDIMHSTVLDAIDNPRSKAEKAVFEELKANIEIVQESSKRAVEAADNVVHAYDLNLQMPETPLDSDDPRSHEEASNSVDNGQGTETNLEDSDGFLLSMTGKRDRSEELDYHPGPPLKRLAAMTEGGLRRAYRSPIMRTARGTSESSDLPNEDILTDDLEGLQRSSKAKSRTGSPSLASTSASPTQRQVVLRDFMRLLVNEALRSSHPLYQMTTKTEQGETIDVRTEGPHGEVRDLTISLLIEVDVPNIIITEERHLHFALRKVVDNAIKFTESGSITVSLRLARSLVEIRVSDTGCGMTEESKTHLFKPHFQEDATIVRARDGLGLSLFNAKAHVRRNLGGDMTLEHSSTDGPSKGSEFLIRLPLSPPHDGSRSSTTRLRIPTVESRSRESRDEILRPISQAKPGVTSFPPPALTSRHPSPTSTVIPTSVPNTISRPRFNSSLGSHIPINILIAEDNVINRQILVGYLRKLGYPSSSIHLAFDGREAVSQYQRNLNESDKRKRIHAVLMDLWMPNMDGYEATEKILQLNREWRDRRDCSRGLDGVGACSGAHKDDEEVKVIAVTADVTSESLDRAKRTGMRGFISKPYRVLDVEHLIVEHFRTSVQVGG